MLFIIATVVNITAVVVVVVIIIVITILVNINAAAIITATVIVSSRVRVVTISSCIFRPCFRVIGSAGEIIIGIISSVIAINS